MWRGQNLHTALTASCELRGESECLLRPAFEPGRATVTLCPVPPAQMNLQIIPVRNKVFMRGLCYRPTPKNWVMNRLCFDKFIPVCTQLHTVPLWVYFTLKYWVCNFGFDFKWQNYWSCCISKITQNFILLVELFLVLTEFWIFDNHDVIKLFNVKPPPP